MFPAANTWDAISPDLPAFRAHGGKLIMWQGWSDNGIPPTGTVEHYETLAQTDGRSGVHAAPRPAVHVPDRVPLRGGYGGVTSTNLDLTLQIVQWVEGSVAPSQVDVDYTIGSKRQEPSRVSVPGHSRYNRNGENPDVATSFHPVTSPAANEYVNWIGNYLFHRPIGAAQDDTWPDRHSRPAKT